MSRPRIILLDDDRDTREMLHLTLEAAGYDVVEAISGMRLISHLQVDRPDLVLMETVLSWGDGLELCRAIKANPGFAHIPIVFLSSRRSPADVARGLAAGAADYLAKPLPPGLLLGRIREILEERK